jgi:hypothetical protein
MTTAATQHSLFATPPSTADTSSKPLPEKPSTEAQLAKACTTDRLQRDSFLTAGPILHEFLNALRVRFTLRVLRSTDYFTEIPAFRNFCPAFVSFRILFLRFDRPFGSEEIKSLSEREAIAEYKRGPLTCNRLSLSCIPSAGNAATSFNSLLSRTDSSSLMTTQN